MRLAVVAVPLLLAACVTEPELGARRSLLQSLQRPLQPDLTTAAVAARSARIGSFWDHLLAEPLRARRFAAAPEWITDRAGRRTTALPATAARLLRGEAARTGAVPRRGRALWDHIAAPEGDAAHHATALAHLLGIARAPLGEIDDRRHRTDPDDAAEEATLWERLVRRLRL